MDENPQLSTSCLNQFDFWWILYSELIDAIDINGNGSHVNKPFNVQIFTCLSVAFVDINWHCFNKITSVVWSSRIRSFKMVSLLCTLLKIFLFIFVINKFSSIDGFEIYLQQVDVKSPVRLAGVYNIKLMRVIKYNRTAYVLNGDLEIETDLDDTYSVHVFSHTS